MTEYLVVIGFFILAFTMMAIALHFSKYKKRSAGCCGGDNCSTDSDGNKVNSCYNEKLEVVDKFAGR